MDELIAKKLEEKVNHKHDELQDTLLLIDELQMQVEQESTSFKERY